MQFTLTTIFTQIIPWNPKMVHSFVKSKHASKYLRSSCILLLFRYQICRRKVETLTSDRCTVWHLRRKRSHGVYQLFKAFISKWDKFEILVLAPRISWNFTILQSSFWMASKTVKKVASFFQHLWSNENYKKLTCLYFCF